MKRILLCLTIIFTVISSGMMHIVFHVCTSEPVVKQTIENDCCTNKRNMPKCCESENKIDIEPSFCCENVQWYYFTPKFNEGFNKQLKIPIPHCIQLGNIDLTNNRINVLNPHQLKQIPFQNRIPPNLPCQEDICVWTI